MTKLERIQESVSALTDDEVKAFAQWFEEFRADLWDEQIARDSEAGRLDALAEAALKDHRAGRTRLL